MQLAAHFSALILIIIELHNPNVFSPIFNIMVLKGWRAAKWARVPRGQPPTNAPKTYAQYNSDHQDRETCMTLRADISNCTPWVRILPIQPTCLIMLH